jgi:hypothetical protein
VRLSKHSLPLRLVAFVESNDHVIKLGSHETDKTYLYKHTSPTPTPSEHSWTVIGICVFPRLPTSYVTASLPFLTA